MDGIEQAVVFATELSTHLIRLAVALVCGLLLGIERERKDKPAGLRTILLICLGSALLMIISNLIPYAYEWPEATRVDPSRVAEGIVTGIGFLGAGTIIQSRGSVQGLTTAAVIWVSAAIGMCAGMGYLSLALIFTAVVLSALVAMAPLRKRLNRLGHRYDMDVFATDDSLVLARIQYLLETHDVPESDIHMQPTTDDEVMISFTYHGHSGSVQRLLEAMARIDGVHGKPSMAS